MTGPQQEEGAPFPFAPARRSRRSPQDGAASAQEASEEADLERGRTLALLATMGRMQLRLDLLSREQSDALASVQNLLTGIDTRLAAVERHLAPPPGPTSTP